MNILLLGSGGREHAFAWKLSQSTSCKNLYIAPGNAGTSLCGQNVPISATDFNALETFCEEKAIDMVVVGPEAPLVAGIYDFFVSSEKLNHIPVIGPSKSGAMLEGSKSYAKAFMERHHIPTAGYREFSSSNLEEGIKYLSTQSAPIVLKADGLAAGKGVLICTSIEHAIEEFKEMLSGKFGDASSKVVIEEFMEGIEFSVFVLTDGKSYKILPIAKDYKRIGEGDTGLNTGGMGAISRPPFVSEALMKKVEETVIIPTIEGFKKDNITYKGFVYIGLMNMAGNIPKVVEYNCRMGDPETQAVIPRIKTDLVKLFEAIGNETLDQIDIELDQRSAATIVMASGGYPENYEKGKLMYGMDSIANSIVFHAGTKIENGNIVTNGGRVVAITSLHNDWKMAVQLSNEAAKTIQFEGKYFRKDIGFDL